VWQMSVFFDRANQARIQFSAAWCPVVDYDPWLTIGWTVTSDKFKVIRYSKNSPRVEHSSSSRQFPMKSVPLTTPGLQPTSLMGHDSLGTDRDEP